jgi:SAM-dependent methyltransferase
MDDLVEGLIESELATCASRSEIRTALLELASRADPADASRVAALVPWLVALRHDLPIRRLPFRIQGPEAVAAAIRESGWLEDQAEVLLAVQRELSLTRLCEESDDQAFCDALLESTQTAAAMLDAARDGTGRPAGKRLASLVPWLYEMRSPDPGLQSPEHEAPESGPALPRRPLLDHLAERVLARKLAPLESGRWLQLGDNGLNGTQVQDAALMLRRIRDAGLMACLRAALLHLDIAKARQGHRPSVHNLASMQMLRRERPPGFIGEGLLQRFTAFRDRPRLEELCQNLVAAHGLVGQHLRGETTASMLVPWIAFVRDLDVAGLAQDLGSNPPADELRHQVSALLVLVDLCDTAGVREGLMTSALWDRFLRVHEALRRSVAEESAWPDPHELLDEPASPPPATGAELVERIVRRLVRLRSDRILAGEPSERLARILNALSPAALERCARLLGNCQLWYCERATAELSPESQLRLLCLAMRRAELDPDLDETRPYHVSFRSLMNQLWPSGRLESYRIRLLEAILEPLSLEQILTSDAPVDSFMPEAAGQHDLGTFLGRIDEEPCVEVRFEPSAEAAALLTLLPIYERKRPAAFHATLKSLCDLYGLRKDEYDRVNNESSYLASMNAARSDKSRMLDYVVPGRVVEVGPGGGVVLDLLEERFPNSEVVGLDISEAVVAALQRKRALENRRWRVVQGDAFELSALFGERSLSSVVFCSILHEIYSYVPWPCGAAGERKRFQLGSVGAMLRAAFRCLDLGGRLVIRDGVQPPAGLRILRFKHPEGAATLELFAKEFEGRPIRPEWLGPDLVRLGAHEAMEFLYTYTWGPEAFPYEVREQYGILTLKEYRRALMDWLAEADPRHVPSLIEVPPDLASYLQPGYVKALEPLVELYEGDVSSLDELRPVAFPDSNCLIVVEKALESAPG